MKSLIGVIWIIWALVFAVPLFPAGDAAAGKDVYAKKCANCHGAVGEGKESVAKMLKVEIRHLGSKEVQTKDDADLKKTLLEGIGKMKAVTGIDAKVADDIVAYVRSLAKK